MTIDKYLLALHARRRALVYETLQSGDVASLALLLEWRDIRVCCSPTWHRRYWRYNGGGRFECEVCRRIAV